MTQKQVRDILKQASINLAGHQRHRQTFSQHSGQTEWNLAHHFACEIGTLVEDNLYDVDVEISKRNFNNRRPDIIVHKRGPADSMSDNLLVVECKMAGNETGDDESKIREDWFSPPLSYRYGAIVVFDGWQARVTKLFRNPSDRA